MYVKKEKTHAGLSSALGELRDRISNSLHDRADCVTAIPGLYLYRNTAPTAPVACSYEPSLLIVPQGRKRVDLGRTSFVFGQSQFLLTSVELPIVSQVVRASKETPYLAFFLKLEMATVREVLNMEEIQTPDATAGTHGMAVGETTVELVKACTRLVELLNTPRDIPFMEKLLQREIIYRLLHSTQGSRLRAIATLGDQSHRTAKAVAWLRTHYTKPLRVEELATLTGMGLSTLHHHFRALTAMSPLQFQKQLRLHAARQRMLTEDIDAASAAFDVGYESPSQFSREYKRFFGQPPMRDIQAMRTSI